MTNNQIDWCDIITSIIEYIKTLPTSPFKYPIDKEESLVDLVTILIEEKASPDLVDRLVEWYVYELEYHADNYEEKQEIIDELQEQLESYV